ncbi:type II toxin-antitoxin system death-on-curing family toxin [Sinisalibacter aestuarii]|uniref:Death-on-curing family protein n=1 Tax=Sinisalibacter aestuarii TaxID=2949426 RepID=A0ABQ5LQL7_9RHOB|nr:type II toxin-antitoxin system death-on-curing family toxin [Sinisalibacter aestuarii]GKY87302.1 death-on-curing family protein [Sinisalibacter aestuarii]
MFTLTAELVEAIHDEVLNPGELAGRAMHKSLEGALARVDTRLAYGMVGDVYDLSALYAVVIATGHCFNDANKRTAFRSMEVCLEANGVSPTWDVQEIGDIIIRVAQGLIDEAALADWLRGRG